MSNNGAAVSIYEVILNIDGNIFSLQLPQGGESIAFDFAVADIIDISKRDSSSSRALSFPYNTHNQIVFDNILSVNARSFNFDPNIQTPVSVLVDSVEVFNGYLQFNSGSINLAAQTGTCDCTIYSGNMNFWTLLGEGYLTDLDFSEFNHIYNYQNEIASWSKDYRSGYFYPLIDYGYGWGDISQINGAPQLTNVGFIEYNYVFPNQLYPATYVYTIMDRLFLSTSTVSTAPDGTTYSQSPWKWKSKFFDGGGPSGNLFKNLLIPFSRGTFNYQGQYGLNLNFSAGQDFDQQYTINIDSGLSNFNYGGPWIIPIDNNTEPYGFDTIGYWDDNQHIWTNVSGATISVSFKGTLTIGITGSLYTTTPLSTFNYPVLQVFRSRNPDGTTNSNWDNAFFGPTFTGAPFPTDPTTGAATLNLTNGNHNDALSTIGQPGTQSYDVWEYNWSTYAPDNTLSPTYFPERYLIQPGESIRFMISGMNISLASGLTNVTESLFFQIIGQNTGLGQNSTGIASVPNNIIPLGSLIQYNYVLPANVKKKDFFNSIVKMFNLYIETSKTDPYTLIIEPRDDYYTQGTQLDWSPSGGNKLDTSQDIRVDILSNTQPRSTLFTYTPDKDYYNSQYKDYWLQTYGQYIYIRENQWDQSQQKIDCIFSPTPMVGINNSSIVIPKFDKITYNNQSTQISNTDVNIRIVQRSETTIIGPSGSVNVTGLLNTDNTIFGNNSWAFATSTISIQGIINLQPGQIFVGIWSGQNTYATGNIVKSRIDGNYYINIHNILAANYSYLGQYSSTFPYIFNDIVTEDVLYWRLNVPAAQNYDPANNPGTWLGFLSLPNSNPDPSLDPTDWSYFSQGIPTQYYVTELGYPYVGHFDNPYTPTKDINWSQTLGLYYDIGLISDWSGIGNNLLNTYYYNQLTEQAASTNKMITCEMNLTPKDINQFYFSSTIYLEIDGEPGLYYVNSIKNFDPSQRTTCTVELITNNTIAL